jgi:probable HAF family extracellular repeat protein
MTDLGTLGGLLSVAKDISPAGEIVGYSDPERGGTRAVVWRAGAITDLGTLPGYLSSHAYAVNARGQIAGSSTAGGRQHAVVWMGR